MKHYDVIVIGAGAAGLMAAWELVQAGRSVALMEARDRTGGRIHSLRPPGFEMTIEAGAEFIHGDLDHTTNLLTRTSAEYHLVKGEIWQKNEDELRKQKDFIEDYKELKKKFRELEEDMSVADFCRKYLDDPKYEKLHITLKNYVEGYYAGDTGKSSIMALREELENSSEKQYRTNEGYSRLVDYLHHNCLRRGADLYLLSKVETVEWKPGHVDVFCRDIRISGSRLITTVPVAVLQNEMIRFSPALPHKTSAAKQLGFGEVIKVILQFQQPFWKQKQFTWHRNLSDLGFLFSEEAIPTWWTTEPRHSAILTGWCSGPHVSNIKHLDNEGILTKAIESLVNIFNLSEPLLRENLRTWHIANWPMDPYGCLGYSYQVVNGTRYQQIIKTPEAGTLFFAGEGLEESPLIGTVEAALKTGQDAAFVIISSS